MRGRTTILFFALAVLIILLFVVDMMVGSVGNSAQSVVAALMGGECDPMTRKIVVDIRLMRAVVAF